jgi:hypothetical protein
MLLPNRVVALATALVSLVLAVLPVVGNFDWTSTAGALAGIIGVLTIASKWLTGWQAHENNEAEQRVMALHALAADQEVPGQVEGVKAEGFEPAPEA